MVACSVFLLTCLCYSTIIGIIGAFSFIKHSMGEEFFLKEGFLGILDAISFAGTVLGNFSILVYPLKKPKLAYTIQTVIHVSLIFISFQLAEYLPEISKLFLIIAMLVSGFCRAFMVIPRAIFINNSNSN